MTPAIDNGDLFGREMFAMDPNETPNTLLAKGFTAGTRLLDRLFDPLLARQLTPTKQDESEANYFRASDIPNDGYFDCSWDFIRFERFFRGLDFRPLPNPLSYPTGTVGGRVFYAQSSHLVSPHASNSEGQIVAITDDCLHVQIHDSVVALWSFVE